MKRVIAIGSALAMLAIPAGAAAKPDKADRTNAAKECRSERGATDATREAFAVKYGTNANKKNAFGKCVSQRARDEEQEGVVAHKNASKECKAEAATMTPADFALKYGAKGGNAHGKCVSQKAKAKEAEADAVDQEQIADRKSAARTCDEERGETAASRAAFAEKYGTNKNNRNAFGKCVSQTAKALQQEEEPPVVPTV